MIKMKCKFCNHEWETKSKYQLVSCPRCGNKNKVNKDKEDYINMEKKTKIKYVYQKKLLKTQNVCGVSKGEINDNITYLSKIHNIPEDEINLEFD